ncbi:MFS transporter [Streptomyces anthocyanicus]|uniref:protein spdB n=1 Tax=Streptomyces anthocyanicus TaxID=68174 RepID=UPI00364343CC
MSKLKRLATVGPAVLMTVVSMVLTLAVVVMWLGPAVGLPVALVVGLGIDGGWLATLAYERRLAAQGDHSTAVTAVGWSFGAVATGVLVAHAVGEDSPGAWLAVAWLPIAAKALWLVHGLWERTALTPDALDQIREIQQEARDDAAVARAQLRAQAATEETRLTAVTAAGARVARVQAKTAETLSGAWSTLEAARQGDGTARALTCVTERVTPESQPRWELPVWGPTEPVAALESGQSFEPVYEIDSHFVTTNDELDRIIRELRDSETPPLSYREMAARFRAAGHAASEGRLRASWRRVTAGTEAA